MGQTHTIGRVATSVFTEDGVTRVVYHSTPVVSFDNETITLRTDGWTTGTTKTRMNQAANQFGLGFYVFQKDYTWYVAMPDGRTEPFTDMVSFAR